MHNLENDLYKFQPIQYPIEQSRKRKHKKDILNYFDQSEEEEDEENNLEMEENISSLKRNFLKNQTQRIKITMSKKKRKEDLLKRIYAGAKEPNIKLVVEPGKINLNISEI